MPEYPPTKERGQHAEQLHCTEHAESFTHGEKLDNLPAGDCDQQATQIAASRHATELSDNGELEHPSADGFDQQPCSSKHTIDGKQSKGPSAGCEPLIFPQEDYSVGMDDLFGDYEKGEVAILEYNYPQPTQPFSPKFAPTPGREATPLTSQQLPCLQLGDGGQSPTQPFSDGHVEARLGDTNPEYRFPNFSEPLAVQAGIIKDRREFDGEPGIPYPGGNGQAVASIDRRFTRTTYNQRFNIDWSDIRLLETWDEVKDSRMLIHPKIEQVHILTYGAPMWKDTWVRVENPSYPVTATILVVESGPLQVGCTIVRNESFGCFFFDPDADQVVFYNNSKGSFNLTKPGEETVNSIGPFHKTIIPAGIWALSTLGESLVEFEVMKRIDWGRNISRASSSKRALSPGVDVAKRRKVSKAGKAITTRMPQQVSKNPLLRLQEGDTLCIDNMFQLKYLRTIYSNGSVSVLLVEYYGQDWADKRAVKILTRPTIDAEGACKSWLREYEIHSSLDHPCIVKFLGGDARLKSFYIEYVEAESLAHQVGEDLSFTGSRADALKVLNDMALALAKVHSEGVVHADFKPANVLYSPQRGAVLIDFGLAFRRDNPNFSSGTPWYLAPEFIEESRLRGPPSDIWALGVTILWLLGHIPFPEASWKGWKIADMHSGRTATEQETATRAMFKTLDKINDARSRLDKKDKLEAIVLKTLQQHVRDRIDAKSLCEQLSELQLTTS
ncbi:kinase-like domain-containing protein [Hypoxylon argillaceum]|nr:kinase-like domain-containing protein [Hypoxylon argillaceum]